MTACDRCPHDFDSHNLVTTGEDPTQGGVIICPHIGCACYATWDVPPYSTKETIRIPDEEELVLIRSLFQKEDP